MHGETSTGRATDAAEHFPEPVVIISDVHLPLGRQWRRHADRLRGLWSGAGTVVFNGDTISFRGKPEIQARSLQVLDGLTEMCAADGARAALLAGNTDFAIDAPKHLWFADGRILVTHGDVIFPEISPWQPHARRLHAARQSALQDMGPTKGDTLEGQLAAVRRAQLTITKREGERQRPLWSRAFRQARRLTLPAMLPRLLRAWRAAPDVAAAFVERWAPQTRCIVLGHTHHPGVWYSSGPIVVNTGGFRFPHRSWAVWVAGRTITVRKVRRARAGWEPGEQVTAFEV